MKAEMALRVVSLGEKPLMEHLNNLGNICVSLVSYRLCGIGHLSDNPAFARRLMLLIH